MRSTKTTPECNSSLSLWTALMETGEAIADINLEAELCDRTIEETRRRVMSRMRGDGALWDGRPFPLRSHLDSSTNMLKVTWDLDYRPNLFTATGRLTPPGAAIKTIYTTTVGDPSHRLMDTVLRICPKARLSLDELCEIIQS